MVNNSTQGKRIKHVETINGVEETSRFYYMGSAVLYTSDAYNVLQTENILDLAGTTIMSFRFLWPYQAQNEDYANQWFTYRYDVRGSVTNITNPQGEQVKGYKYNEFGQTKEAGQESFQNELTFTGGVKDTSTGLQYMNARFYEPQTGRFLSQDTYSGNAYDPWTQHLYAYCANNPVNFIDPTGHAAKRTPEQQLQWEMNCLGFSGGDFDGLISSVGGDKNRGFNALTQPSKELAKTQYLKNKKYKNPRYAADEFAELFVPESKFVEWGASIHKTEDGYQLKNIMKGNENNVVWPFIKALLGSNSTMEGYTHTHPWGLLYRAGPSAADLDIQNFDKVKYQFIYDKRSGNYQDGLVKPYYITDTSSETYERYGLTRYDPAQYSTDGYWDDIQKLEEEYAAYYEKVMGSWPGY